MPPFVKIKTAPARSRRGPSLECLVFRMGGIAGAVRRIVHRSSRPLTMNQLYAAMQRQYPALHPARNQVEEIVQDLVAHGKVEFKYTATNVRAYHWRTTKTTPFRLTVKKATNKQLVFVLS